MSSQTSFGTSLLFQTMSDELNASMATADELSREFSSLMEEAASTDKDTKSESQARSPFSSEQRQSSLPFNITGSTRDSSGSLNGSSKFPIPSSFHPTDSVVSSSFSLPSSPVFTTSPLSSPKINRAAHSPLPRIGSDNFLYGQQSPKQPSHMKRQSSPSHFDRSPHSSASYMDRTPSPQPGVVSVEHMGRSSSVHGTFLNPYDNNQMGRRSPRADRNPSPLSFSHPSSTLPRNFFRKPEESSQRPKIPSKWNESNLDDSYEKKPHHTYDKTEWLRQSVPNSNWRESNLDGPPPASPKKDPRFNSLQYSHSSLPRNTRIAVPPDVSSASHSPHHPQPIISRISIPPTSTRPHQRKPIPLSVIMRLQNPHWGPMASTRHPGVMSGEGDLGPPYQPPMPLPREFFRQPMHQPHQHPPELRQPAIYSDALNPGDVDAELERQDYFHHIPVILGNPGSPEGGADVKPPAPRPRSPTKLQPVVAPEAQTDIIPDLEELLRIRAEIPRALKRRGSVDQSLPLKKASHYQPNQYKNLIDKLFHRKDHHHKGEQGSETSSSSDGEDCAMPPTPLPAPSASTIFQDLKSYHSILRRPNRERKGSGRRARLSPLVLLLDGALVGELETVQKAVQEMTDPSQPNDEGITGLHNAVCGGHYNVVDFLVRIGANVSAPDSHGWTPLHCAASCNDRPLCEFLVRSGAAVMAMTESDGAVASQKCDPYAQQFTECEGFLRGVEEAMGVDNSGVLYALWSYPAQMPDELSFKEGDMVTILQKPEGSDWWWASLCGREGFVPNNYFGLFPKVRPKSLC